MPISQHPTFHCYAARPTYADLPPHEAVVYAALREVSRYFALRGMSAPMIAGMLRNTLTRDQVEAALTTLAEQNLAEEVTAGRWRRVPAA